VKTQDRSTQVTQAINDWNHWLTPEARNEKYAKKAVSPFAFYRGTNHLFWMDFAGDERLAQFGDEHNHTWLQGDLHAENFGAFTNDEGRVVYSVNDFDEAIFADYQYDVLRMAISLGIEMDGVIKQDDQVEVIARFARAYLETLDRFCENDKKTKGEFTQKNTQGKLRKFLEESQKDNSRAKLLGKWTKLDGERRFDLANYRLNPVSRSRRDEILAAVPGYMLTLSGAGKALGADHLHVKDLVARLSAGIGSLGTPRYYLLVEGKSSSPDDDVILDVKRQSKPSAYRYLDQAARDFYDRLFANDAQRAAIAYRAMTHNTDDYLGWMRLSDGSYLVRERTFVKEAFPLKELTGAKDFKKMAKQWGKILATVHARADRLPETSHEESFEQRVTKRVGKRQAAFEGLVCDVALGYAAQVKIDWEEFVKEFE